MVNKLARWYCSLWSGPGPCGSSDLVPVGVAEPQVDRGEGQAGKDGGRGGLIDLDDDDDELVCGFVLDEHELRNFVCHPNICFVASVRGPDGFHQRL